MLPFRDRPVTYLFLGATVAIDAALASVALPRTLQAEMMGLVIGQIALSGAWLTLGSTHRLLRGAAFIAATAALAALVQTVQGPLKITHWHRMLAGVFVIQLVVAAAAALELRMFRRLRLGTPDNATTSLRYPVVELFGWTIVVATASLLLRETDILRVFQQWRSVVYLCYCAAAGLIAAALHHKKLVGSEIALVIVLSTALIGGCYFAPSTTHPLDRRILSIALVYVISYCLCRRLDMSLKQSATVLDDPEEPTSE